MTEDIAARQVTDAWRRIEAWLREHAPVTHAALGPGASTEEITGVEAALGFALPVELRTLWGLVSGGNVNGSGFWLDNRALMRPEDVMFVYRLKMDIQRDLDAEYDTPGVPGEDDIIAWQPGWIPVFSKGEHNSVYGTFLDSESGLLGHWDKYPYEPPGDDEPQNSIVTYLEEMADSLEMPTLATQTTPGLLDGRLVWECHYLDEDEQRRWRPVE
ncbi:MULTISPECIES: SMI1/KNR4 family protein [Streptomyces]|uniref:SMI1/KNR4 family protein n=1 Tax=Streptomyces TaxID=1883 RepID=UPI00292E9BE7|nr:SMI1/KNR4 family protein [Streptomyces sp. NEAU-HV9]